PGMLKQNPVHPLCSRETLFHSDRASAPQSPQFHNDVHPRPAKADAPHILNLNDIRRFPSPSFYAKRTSLLSPTFNWLTSPSPLPLTLACLPINDLFNAASLISTPPSRIS